ncbi:YusU family protein [Bacillus sp. ISL-47]|uniref:YusU family protein n=1 Tax=Bacillus sp. ISL-47 TaxID=2819130 RepID=UPI001BEC874A|nr:YusU family protein [Bacillus sp. ISL-47]MBT2687515.1 YusU family protein [Bacillus sp. ISL-47]MBT2706489.1 YusU family protein [Pseudomonas sp. ISL-84]
MDVKFKEQLDGLLEKYTELLIGESDPELKEKVEAWALYSFIAKSLPPLAKHWNDTYPDAKEEMKALIAEIKKMNEELRSKKSN